MHKSPVLLTDSQGQLWRMTSKGSERVRNPFQTNVLSWLARALTPVRW